MGTFIKSDDPDEMPHNALFVKVKKIFRPKIQHFFKSYYPIRLDMYNGLSLVYCIKPEGRNR